MSTADLSHVYICTGGDNAYFHMALVSAMSLVEVAPHARVLLLVDEDTGLQGVVEALCPRLAVEIRRVEVPATMGPTARSRYIRTRLPRLVDGPCLHIDSDTMVVMPPPRLPDCIQRPPGGGVPAVAGALNRHRGAPYHVASPWVVPVFQQMGWQYPVDRFLNGGVLWFDGTDRAREFADHWHAAWLAQRQATGEERDQASLNHTVQSMPGHVGLLPLGMNAVVGAAPSFARGASILHFFTTGGQPPEGSLLDRALARLNCGQLARGGCDVIPAPEALANLADEDLNGRGGRVEDAAYVGWAFEAAKRLDAEAAWRHVAMYRQRVGVTSRSILLAPFVAALLARARWMGARGNG